MCRITFAQMRNIHSHNNTSQNIVLFSSCKRRWEASTASNILLSWLNALCAYDIFMYVRFCRSFTRHL